MTRNTRIDQYLSVLTIVQRCTAGNTSVGARSGTPRVIGPGWVHLTHGLTGLSVYGRFVQQVYGMYGMYGVYGRSVRRGVQQVYGVYSRYGLVRGLSLRPPASNSI